MENINYPDELIKSLESNNAPGCAFAVISKGKIIDKKVFGLANLEYNIPNTPDTVFYTASLSKQFSAAAIAILAENGSISLQDKLSKYFSDMPEYFNDITIRNIIHHTSGLKCFLTLLMLTGKPTDHSFVDDDALSIIKSQKSLNFKPGEKYSYSNAGYFLMSQIVKTVTGQTHRQFTTENIFNPLGMKNTFFQDNHREIIQRRATGYSQNEDKYYIDVPNFDIVGSGGLYTTLEDMYKWDQNFYNNQIGNKTQYLIDTILTQGILNNGTKIDYAFGLEISTYKGFKTISHSGNYAAYTSYFIQFPEKEFSVICLSNSGNVNAPAVAMQVIDTFINQNGEEKQQTVTTPNISKEPIDLSSKLIMKYSGMYFSKSEKIAFTLIPDGSSFNIQLHVLGLPPLPLTTLSENKFYLDQPFPILVDFSTYENDGILNVILGAEDVVQFEKLEQIPFSDEFSKAILGKYYSSELDTIVEIFCENNEIIMRLGAYNFPIIEGFKNMAIIPNCSLEFHLPIKNDIVPGFLLHNERAMNMIFERID